MRLLMIAFVMDESHGTMGWQVHVAKQLAARVEHVTVIASQVGRVTDLPDNLEIITPPVRPLKVPHRLGGRWAFNWHVHKLCKEKKIDGVFIHMAMEWAFLLRPTFAKLKIPTVMWYAHGTVTNRLRLAVKCVDRVVTSTPEGCRIDSDKIRVIGQGIDTDVFKPRENVNPVEILSVGRVSPRKNVDKMVPAAQLLRDEYGMSDLKIRVVGPLMSMEDVSYDHSVRDSIWRQGVEDHIQIDGFIPKERLPELYDNTFLHLNLSKTGSMDKTVMEALACGCPVLTCNEAFFDILKDYPEFILEEITPELVAKKIAYIKENYDKYDPQKLRELVMKKHSLDTYADRVLAVLDEVVKQED